MKTKIQQLTYTVEDFNRMLAANNGKRMLGVADTTGCVSIYMLTPDRIVVTGVHFGAPSKDLKSVADGLDHEFNMPEAPLPPVD